MPDEPPLLGAPMHVTVDCADARALAGFWSALTGQSVAHAEGPYVFLTASPRHATAMAFQQVADPTPGKNRVHVDFRAADLTAVAVRIGALGGAVIARHDEMGAHWLVAADPEGNAFCVVESATA